MRVRGHDFPLPPGTGHGPGAELRLKLIFVKDEWQLQIIGPAGSAKGVGSNPTAKLAELLAGHSLSIPVDRALRLIPKHLPPTDSAVAALLNRLSSAQGAGPALGQVIQILNEAAAAGAIQLSPSAVAALGWLIRPGASADAYRSYLRRAASAPPESLLARWILGGEPPSPDEVAESPEQVWSSLSDDERLIAFVERDGRGEILRRALRSLTERTEGDRLVELHALNQGYRFVELPMEEASGWSRAQLHLLRGRPGAVAFALDAHTERLGDIWMVLRMADSEGYLQIQAERDATRTAFEHDVSSIRDALARVGFERVTVEVEAWDADRLRAAAELFETYRSIEVTV